MVTSTVGKRRFWALRSAAGVSPLRTPAVQRTKLGAPSALTVAFNTSSGCCSARKVSAARARIGVIHKTVRGAALGSALSNLATVFLIADLARTAWTRGIKGIKTIKAPSQTA